MTSSRKTPEAAELPAEELAALARSGDRASFEELVVRYRPRLVAFLARRVASPADAEDVAQETFVRAHEHLDRYDSSRPFGTWLFTIGKNVAANHALAGARRTARERASAAEPAAIEVASAETSDAIDASDLWQRAARVLPPDTYRMLWLRYAKSYSVREIATEMNRSSVAIKVMLFRARRRLLEEGR